tara:strand:+ start:5915 stop:6295 length:381 start_codon:yes stop_codon:yes gene_type:complete
MLEQLIGPVTGLLDKFIEDKDQKAKLAHEIATMSEKHALELSKAQIDLNKTEAAHKSLFVAGWRPATGWVCVLGFFVNFLISPLAAGFGVDIPQADTATMLPVLMGMLGLGGMRTFEKQQRISREK